MPDPGPDRLDLMRAIILTYDETVTSSLQRAGFVNIRRGQLVVLRLVDAGVIEPGSISKHLGTTQQWVSKCLTILSAEACLEAVRHPLDGRRKEFAITDRGRRAVAIARAWTEQFATYGSLGLGDDLAAVLAKARRDADTLSLHTVGHAA